MRERRTARDQQCPRQHSTEWKPSPTPWSQRPPAGRRHGAQFAYETIDGAPVVRARGTLADVHLVPHHGQDRGRQGVSRRRKGDGVAIDLVVMGSETASLLQQALALPEDEREMLAAELLASLHGRAARYSADQADPCARDIERRIERLANAESAGIDLATARQQVRAALADR